MGVVNKTFGESWKRGKLTTALAAALLAVLAAVVLAASPAFAQETTSQAPSQGGQYGVSPGEAGTTTVNFALTTNGTPPADATFFAQTVQGIAVQLTDPDGDGVYTGSYTYNTQAFPEGAPFSIVQGTRTAPGQGNLLRPGELSKEIKNFGVVSPKNGDTLSASVTFPTSGNTSAGTPATGQSAPVQGSSRLTLNGHVPEGQTFYVFQTGINADSEATICQTAYSSPSAGEFCQGGGAVNTLPFSAPAGSHISYTIYRYDAATDSTEAVSSGTAVAKEGLAIDASYTFHKSVKTRYSAPASTTGGSTTDVAAGTMGGGAGGAADSSSADASQYSNAVDASGGSTGGTTSSGTISGDSAGSGGGGSIAGDAGIVKGISGMLPDTGGILVPAVLLGVALIAGGMILAVRVRRNNLS